MPYIDKSKPPRRFTVVNAVMFDDDDLSKIAGVPEYHTDTFGEYTGYFPYMAAEKAVTGIHGHMKKYPTWFPEFTPDNAPSLIFVIMDMDTGALYAYNGWRETAPQSRDQPRLVEGDAGRVRSYQWVSRVKSMKVEDVLEE